MAAALTLRCTACGEAFLVTQTRPDSLATCPYCAHSAPLRELAVEGSPSLEAAAPVARRRRKPRAQESPAAADPLQMELTWEDGVPEALPAIEEPVRRGPARPAFVPLEIAEDEAPVAPPPARQALAPWKMLVGVLGALALAGLGWWINHTPEERVEVAPVSRPPEAPAQEVRPAVVATADPEPVRPNAGPPPAPSQAAVAPPTAEEAWMEAEIDSARLTSEAPEVLRALFEGPAQDRPRQVLGGERWAESVTAFFQRDEPLTVAALRRLPVTPVDLVSGEPAVLFQIATSANEKGALGRFFRGRDGALRLDWGLFQETHDLELERFASAGTEDAEPRWFRAGLRRSHGLGLSEAFRESQHVFDLQAAPGGLLGIPGHVARELPVGRYLNQKTDWRAIYLARLLLKARTLPDGTRVLEILDCEGTGLSRSEEYREEK